jgi:hypothetical protein
LEDKWGGLWSSKKVIPKKTITTSPGMARALTKWDEERLVEPSVLYTYITLKKTYDMERIVRIYTKLILASTKAP